MARKNTKKETSRYGDVETVLSNIIVSGEYTTAKSNDAKEHSDYEAILDMVDGVRAEKNAKWKSDINIPLVISHMLTDAAAWTSYFQTRDFVDVYLEGETGDKPKTEAVKKLINKTLNMKDIYHYHKFMRMRILNWICGNAVAICYWEKDIREKMVPQPPIRGVRPEQGYDGNTIYRIASVPQPDKKVENIVTDRFNYEPLDPRNVFMSSEYCYSVQQKDWVIVRSERTLGDLMADEEANGYFNLDLVKEQLSDEETDTSKETYNKKSGKEKSRLTPLKKFDELTRFGKIWAVVNERDDEDVPVDISPGYDSDGNIIKGAELIEGIVAFALPRKNPVLIRFQPTPFIDSKGRPFKPLVRSWCYIHPSDDSGLSDGKNLREIQVSINDTFNISNDAVMMETFPTLVGKKSSLEDNPTVYQEPEHIIELEDPANDLQQLRFRANINGAWTQINSLLTFASQTDAIYPATMGGQSAGDTTATEVSYTAGTTNARRDLKTLTFEYTWLLEFYWLINQMTYRFAHPQTALKLMGELAYVFDPDADYTYVPLSQSLEAEHNKLRKVSAYDQMIGRLTGLVQIDRRVIPIIAKITGRQAVLMGSEYQEWGELIEELYKPNPNPPVDGKGATQTADAQPEPMSNQTGMPQSDIEMNARQEGMSAAGSMM